MKSKEEILISKTGPCRCEEIYTSRGRKDPDCAYCEIGPDIIDAMQEYADQECAELRRQMSEPVDGDWKLIGHSYQIADTGDCDGHYEITNGKISLLTRDDDDEALQPIVNAINSSGCKFYQDDWFEFENDILKREISDLRRQMDELKVAKPDMIVPGEEEQYLIDKENHATFMRGYYACITDALGYGIIDQPQWESIRWKYDARLHMDRPNKPGYYRAAND